MNKKIKIELTEKEASELLSVAGNGYGDGDFYQNGRSGYGDKRQLAAFLRAFEKISIKLNRQTTTP